MIRFPLEYYNCVSSDSIFSFLPFFPYLSVWFWLFFGGLVIYFVIIFNLSFLRNIKGVEGDDNDELSEAYFVVS